MRRVSLLCRVARVHVAHGTGVACLCWGARGPTPCVFSPLPARTAKLGRRVGGGVWCVRTDDASACVPSIMIHAPPTFYTYSLRGVTLHMRRTDPAARAAYVAEALRRHALVFGAEERPHPPCITCGLLGAGDWCNMCEVLGIHPDPALPNWVTPMCHRCIADDIVCPECGIAPSAGPQDQEFWPGEDGVQVAGSM